MFQRPFGLAGERPDRLHPRWQARYRERRRILDGHSSSPIRMAQPDARFSRDGTKIVYLDLLGTSTPAAGSGEARRTSWSPTPTARTRRSQPTTSQLSIRCGRLTGGGSATPRSATAVHLSCSCRRLGGHRPTSASSPPGGRRAGRPTACDLAVAAGDRELWLVNRDGTNAHRISHGDYSEGRREGIERGLEPRWHQLLFGAVGAGEPEDLQDTGLYLVGHDGAL